MGRRLYVGNLPYSVEDQQLEGLFAPFGAVESVHLVRDAATGRPRGFGFVEMATDEEAQAAATSLNETQLDGRTLTVNEARPKPQRSEGFGGRGGGGGRRSEPRW